MKSVERDRKCEKNERAATKARRADAKGGKCKGLELYPQKGGHEKQVVGTLG